MSLPRGVTYKKIAQMFLAGRPIADLAIGYNCSLRDIEHAIRMVMRRNQGGVS